MPQVSYSEVKLFRKCMHAHYLRYVLRLKKKKPAAPLVKGKILHEMLDAYINSKAMKDYTGPDPWGVLERYEKEYGELFAEEREEHGDIPEDCATVFENYLDYYRDDGLRYESSEDFIATDLATDIRYIAYTDKVVVDEHNRRWLMDHKFVKRIPSADERMHEIQLILYPWAWNRWNPTRKVDGIIWDYALSRPPTQPEVLKRGGLSQSKKIKTTAATYLRAIHREGLDPEDYTDMLSSLEGRERDFFERVKLPFPSKSILNSVIEDFRTSAVMIQHLKGVHPKSGMNKFNCNTCEFKAICEAEVRGHDVNFVIKSSYMTRPEREKEENYDGLEDNTD